MTTKNQTTTWRGFRKQARAHAARLEKEAAGARLLAMAEDPLDALAMLWDMAVYERHMADARAARLRGAAEPQPPVPISKLMTRFNQQLEDRSLRSRRCSSPTRWSASAASCPASPLRWRRTTST